MSNDFFAHKAADYEANANCVSNVENIARAVMARVELTPSQHLLDFGSGTGLLLKQLAPFIGKVTAVDVSAAMNQQLETARSTLPCELEIMSVDLTCEPLKDTFDGIISSMTLHHIEDVPAILRTLYSLVKPGGFIALADLDTEDGSFHTEDTGVFHQGFERDWIKQAASAAGFSHVETTDASIEHTATGSYPVFLLTGRK